MDDDEDIDTMVCQTCGGSGVVAQMERVYPGEAHMADVGEGPCPDCSAGNCEDDYDPN